jgi:uncharacterized protein YukE
MTANQLSTRKQKRSTDTLRKNFEDVQDAVDELADALDAGEADVELVTDAYRQIAAATVSIEDAAEDAGAINAHEDRWRAIDESRKALYHTASAISSPRCREDAIDALEAAIEHTEAAGEDE